MKFKFIVICLIVFTAFGKDTVLKQTKERMLKVLSANEKLHEAYFDYDANKVFESAQTVRSLLKKIKSKKLLLNIEKSLKFIDKIHKDKGRADNNKNYHLASVYLLRIINAYDLGEKYHGYYCPMVRMKWIQNVDKKEKVHNPYDPSMPHCGGRL